MDNFSNIFKTLSDKLKYECVLEESSQNFALLKSDYDRFKFSLTVLENADLLPHIEHLSFKNYLQAEQFRFDGNSLFMQKKDMDALQAYTASIASAPIDSVELSLAFANRSAVSFSLKQFQDCIVDIDRALSGKYPDHLKYKLYERKGKCHVNCRENKSAKYSYENALISIYKSKLTEDKIENFVHALKGELKILATKIDDVEHGIVVNDRNLCIQELPRLSYSQSDVILAACDAIRIECNKEMGRYLVATRTINPGDVLVIEKPYASTLLPTAYNLYCFNCLKRCHTLLPCDNCTKALFCCIKCQDSCNKTSHKIECIVLQNLIDLGCSKLELLAVRMLLIASKCDKLKLLKEYIDQFEKMCSDNTAVDEHLIGFNNAGQYRSEDYMTAHQLATNSHLRTNADLFRRSCFSSCIIHCIDQLTDYFVINTVNESNNESTTIMNESYGDYFDNKCFAGGLLLRYLQIMPCNAHEVSEMSITKYIVNEVDGSTVKDFEVGKVDQKSFIYNSREIGGALYPVLSLINHSCDPNVVRHSHNGDTVVLTAIQRIYKGEQIYDNYGYHHAVHDLQTRQKYLLSQYHFTCRCIACVEDWPRYHLLPYKHIIYKEPKLQQQVEKSSEEFRVVLEQVLKGNFEQDDVLGKLINHLSLLEDAIKRPWKEYSECQEAIKQTLSMLANHYVLSL